MSEFLKVICFVLHSVNNRSINTEESFVTAYISLLSWVSSVFPLDKLSCFSKEVDFV